MSKQNHTPRTLKQAAKIAGYHSKEVEEMAKDVGAKMVRDQAEWLDVQMKDILPPKLYQAGLVGELEKEIGDYIAKHEIQILFVPDRQMIRIMIGKQIHSEFVPNFTVDGEPIKITSEMPLDSSRN